MEISRFVLGQPVWLWAGAILPLLLFLTAYSLWKFSGFKKSWAEHPFVFQGKLPPWWLIVAKAVFRIMALALVIVALADPYYLKQKPENFYEGVRVIFVVDISRSMAMAEDVPPNRLAAVKDEIRKIVFSLDGSYQLGIIPFAGTANPYYYPPAFNQSSFLMALKQLDGDSVSAQGTDIVAAFTALEAMLDSLVATDDDSVNLIVFFSDGGKEDGFAVNRMELRAILAKLADRNCHFYINGVGGAEAVYLIKRDVKGNFQGYVVDSKNRPLLSELDENLLQMSAQAAGGSYYRLPDSELERSVRSAIRSNRRLVKVGDRWERVPIRSYLLAAAVLLLVLSQVKLIKKAP